MMIVFFLGMAASGLLIAMAPGPWLLAAALTLMGTFAAIYHPVGIPMLIQGVQRPGWLIGVNGLAGNLGVASAALVTGFLVKYLGWRMAFLLPGIVSLACGLLFAWCAPHEGASPASRKKATGPAVTSARPSRTRTVWAVATGCSGAASRNCPFAFRSSHTRIDSTMHECLSASVMHPSPL